MGGDIFVGIRFKDERGDVKEVLINRWTNDMPWRCMQPSFLNQGKEFYKFINEAKEGNEWPQSKLLHTITNSGYGVVLMDFINRSVLCYSDYFTFGKSSILAEDPCIVFNRSTHNDSVMMIQINGTIELINQGLIKKIEDFNLKDLPTDQFEDKIKEDLKNGENFLYHIHLKEDLFNVDDQCTSTPPLKTVSGWLKKNGWTSEIDKKSFEYEDD
jgi:hypothetical protein